MMGQTGLRLLNDKFMYKRILSSKSILTYHSSHGHNLNIFDIIIGFKLYIIILHTQIKVVGTRYHVSKYYYYIDILHCTIRKILQFSTPYFFFRHPLQFVGMMIGSHSFHNHEGHRVCMVITLIVVEDSIVWSS